VAGREEGRTARDVSPRRRGDLPAASVGCSTWNTRRTLREMFHVKHDRDGGLERGAGGGWEPHLGGEGAELR